MKLPVKIALCITSAAAGIVLYHPAISLYILSFPHVCALSRFAGMYCPFCGGTRAVQSLLTGNFPEAFGMNQMVIILLPLSLGILLGPFRKLKKAAPWILLGIMLLYLILRNIPMDALTFLRPG